MQQKSNCHPASSGFALASYAGTTPGLPSSADRRFGRRGSLLLEAVLGIALFGMFLAATAVALLAGQEGTMGGGNRTRAVAIAHEGLEVARSVRDGSYSSLVNGTYGYGMNSSQRWVLSGTKSTRSGGYVISVSLSSLAADWTQVSANVKWKHGYTKSGSIILQTQLTDWRGTDGPGTWSAVTLDGSYVHSGTPYFNNVAVVGNYAYVTSDTSTNGLYIFNISNTASIPSPTTYSLSAASYGIAAKGRTLYVITNNATSEIRAYNITTPTAPTLITSYNLSGSSLATSLALRGDTLFVGAQQNASYNELYSFNVRNTGAILYMHSLAVPATVNGITLTGTAALLATADTSGEMKRANVATGKLLSFPGSSDYNVTSTEAGRSVFATGTAAILGRTKGSSIQEMMMVHTLAAPMGTPGPWYHEGSGSLIGVSADPAACYGFLAADSSTKAFQVVNLRDTSLPELTTYNSTSGPGRGIFYDIVRDRVIVLTRKGFLIFRPTSSTNVCS